VKRGRRKQKEGPRTEVVEVEVQEDGDEVAMRGTEARRGGEANSVKYPQLDATHWHTVSMQILFTLGLPFPLPVPLSPSLPPVLTLLPSRFTWRAPLRTLLVLHSPLSLITSRGRAKRCATHVCTPYPSPSPSPSRRGTTHIHASRSLSRAAEPPTWFRSL
jgi:hypothetical protein